MRRDTKLPKCCPEIGMRDTTLPVVVQDKKSPAAPSAEESPIPGKLSKFFNKKSPAPTTPIALSGRTLPNGKEVVPNNETSPALPQHVGIYSSPTPRQSQQFVPDSGLKVAEQQSPTHPAVSHAELEALRHEHQRIQDERQRLSRMQALDEEERRVRQRIEQISSPRL
ncbi:hypothetical protein E2P81_ATG04448 [Venturia nashicola]|uniref:Uncharacterized protein n=1 Tax=Venturia nashicola TaxID=86259 RepID=A0A4Z1PAX8_9PEZI|nr:hypothetical protein E6O75_ATG04553 [Venturia nashicola]TLD37636.1 hypothetical protein E2P81_ATG04448 [Venturia nashicola]